MTVPTACAARHDEGWSRSCLQLTARITTVALGLGAAVLLGCDSAEDRVNDGTQNDDWITLDPLAEIGELEGEPTYLFGNVSAVAMDEVGHIYVGDATGPTVRVYSSAGIFLQQLARGGQGPGEIDFRPADLTFDRNGRLYVRDASGVTVFEPPSPGGIADSLAATWRVPGYRNVLSDRGRVGGEATYYYPSVGMTRLNEPPRFSYYPIRQGEPTGDTIYVPPHPGAAAQRDAMYRIGGGNLRSVEGLSRVPFAPLPSWDITVAGTVLSSDGRSSYLLETGPTGDTLRRIPLARPGDRPIPPGERADSLGALEARIDSLPVPLDEVINLGEGVRDRQLPDVLPYVLSVNVAMDGSIWIQRWPFEGEAASRLYDVLDSTGAHRATFLLRAPLVSAPPPFFGRDRVVGVVRDPATGVERVVAFSVPTTAGPER